MSDEVKFEYSKARSKMLLLLDGLSRAASGDVMRRATAKVKSQMRAIAKSKLAAHKDSGNAESITTVTSGDDIVTLTAPKYLGYHGWWPFRGRRIPPFLLNSASKIFEAELDAAVKGEPSPLFVAEQEAAAKAESKAAKVAAKFKREIARIYRQSAEYKAKKTVEARARAKARRAEKKAQRGAAG